MAGITAGAVGTALRGSTMVVQFLPFTAVAIATGGETSVPIAGAGGARALAAASGVTVVRGTARPEESPASELNLEAGIVWASSANLPALPVTNFVVLATRWA